jgi:hypothetical protein
MCGCGGNSSAASSGPLLSTTLDSRFAPDPSLAGSNVATADVGDGFNLASLFSTPGGWVTILFFAAVAGISLYATKKSES